MGTDRQCPECKVILNAVAEENADGTLNDRAADLKPEEITVCAFCAAALRVCSDLSLKRLSMGEFATLDAVTQMRICSLQQHIIQMQIQRGLN